MSINKIQEKKRQDTCVSCGSSIIDHEKECPRCGAFPQKAYHERSASQILGISKWIQNSPTLQANQKLTESGRGEKNSQTKNSIMSKISDFKSFSLDKNDSVEFMKTSYHLDESGGRELNFFEEACLENGVDFSDNDTISEEEFAEAYSELDQIEYLNEGKFGKWLKGIGNKALNLVKNNTDKIAGALGVSLSGSLGPLTGLLGKGITGVLSKLKGGEELTKGSLRDAAAENPEISKVSNVVSQTITKLSDEMKKDPSAFMSGKFLDSLKNLSVLSTTANQSVGQVIKDAAASGVKPK